MKKILIISGHPNLSVSIANATILEEVGKALPNAEIRRLDTRYPTYQFDVEAEQDAIEKADVIVWQFPLFWYAMPGLMKLWLDKVFLYGFAHGSTAKLAGKKLIMSFTTGAPELLYSPQGFFKHEIEDYLYPFETIATLCNLDFQTPIYTYGLGYAEHNENVIHAQKMLAQAHAQRLIHAIKQIV